MGSDKECTSYEERRNRNVERNNIVLRKLGLLSPRGKNEREVKPRCNERAVENLQGLNIEPRRSERLAALTKTSPVSADLRGSPSPVHGRIRSWRKEEPKKQVLKKKVLGKIKEMEHENLEDSYSSDSSTRSLYGVEGNMDFNNSRAIHENAVLTHTPTHIFGSTSTPTSLDSANTQMGAAFGAQFQEFIIRALMQSTASLVGPPVGLMSFPQGGATGNMPATIEGERAEKTLNEATYNIAEARRKRKTIMTRTSAGEGSDSQEDFTVPDNESPQQRSVRTRRLNRFRARRAKDLTSNRKALKKLPYVIHVDGMAKAKGIHKHLWRAAVRGQCGRLDPMMDNINHHPKHVVDSIWHGLQKEWEFEGFCHRGREMFERSATKFMRNRKMQLKTKCKKNVDGPKPENVRGTHWTKIVDVTKKILTDNASGVSMQNTWKGKNPISALEKGKERLPLAEQEINQYTGRCSPNSPRRTSDTFLLGPDDVDARIQSLQSELLRLQKSRKTAGEFAVDEAPEGVFDSVKENVVLVNEKSDEEEAENFSKKTRKWDEDMQTKVLHCAEENNSSLLVHKERELHGEEGGDELQQTEQMDCGDVVRVFAFTGGRKEEIGKAIIMGLAGSKYARKVIPEGWQSIKVTSYTSIGASKLCPFPVGWIEQSKSQTIKEANGRSILWPDMLLVNLVHM